MAHVCIVGAPGSGKSVLSQKFIEQSLLRDAAGNVLPSERLFSTVELVGHDIPCIVVAPTRDEARERGIPYMYDVSCGVLFIDELHKYLPARGYDKLPQEAMDFWTTHRHRDLKIISNTQHVSFIDKIARIITDQVYLCKLVVVPFLGLVKKTVRPPDPCHLQPDCPHPRRDAKGDRTTRWERLLRTGALILYNEYPPSILNDTESLDMNFVEEQGIKKRSSGFLLFDMKYAARARNTVRHTPRPQAALAAAVARSKIPALF